MGRIQARTRLPARPNATVNSAPSRRHRRALPNPPLPVLGSRGATGSPVLHHLPEPPQHRRPARRQGSAASHPWQAGAAPLPLPAPPRAPGRLGALLCSPFLLPGYNYTSQGGSGNTSFFPRVPLGIASGTAGLISHAPGLAPPPRRFLPPGSPGTALAQPWHSPGTVRCHLPGQPRPLPLGQGLPAAVAREGGGGEMKGEGTGDASIGQSVPCLSLFALR